MKSDLIVFFLVSLLYSQNSIGSSIDEKRESIIYHSRLGEMQLRESTAQLESLYRETSDRKVRDDLITLLVRQNRNKDALSLCKECSINDYSVNELEYLAKAARNERQFPQSLTFYAQLHKVMPKNPNGLLGLALVNTDLSNFKPAKQYLAQYRKQFGEDKQYVEVNTYLLDNSEPLIVRLSRWQKELEKNPDNADVAKKIYRGAAQLNILPLRNKLIATYPNLFNENDRLWLLHDEAIRLSKGGTATKVQLEKAYSMLNEANNKAIEGSVLKKQILLDQLVIASKLNNDSYVDDSYSQLQALDTPLPNYAKEAYADYLLASGSPFSALNMYREVEYGYLTEKKKVPFTLGIKIVSAMSDAAKFSQAQDYLDNHMKEPPLYIMDFTRSKKVLNPAYNAYFFGRVNLLAWRGNISDAMQLMNERLDKTPGDPWSMLRKSELESAQGRSDDALKWADKANAFLGDDTVWADIRRANIALNVNDWKTASTILTSLTPEQKRPIKYLIEEYNHLKSGRFLASGGISHRTSPVGQPNESKQEYYLYSPKTDNGHDVYAHYLSTKSPDDGFDFEQRRIGVGVDFTFYPVVMTAEVGKGTKLNDKNYLSTNIKYRLNQHWSFSLYGNVNGSNTPVKAIYQDVYTKDMGFATTYTYSNRLQVGVDASAMKFDDENLRKNVSLWSNLDVFKYDRWSLDSSLFWSYQRNKETPSAYYYNPLKSQSAEGSLDLAYLQPFDHRIVLTHHLKGGVGRYWQENYASSQTWSIAYGQEWRLGKRLGISYDLGRKKSIYDGSPEFNNFINANLAIYFE
ncbi:MAG TPA: poly-beta-1,6 N-acetyl-D-glucosamine export porin PgaA [Pasteurellaceae bacterium]|nr:poly-beta-1,6 N-acetyl-D-glucosamine export porin PgaA [Pasteurellaceae bacterium]